MKIADKYYLGIVAKKSDKYESGYEIADHVKNADTLVKVGFPSEEISYHPLNLQEQENLPGQKLVEAVNKNHPDLNALITGNKRLKYQGLKEGIVNESYEAGKDVNEAIGKYRDKLQINIKNKNIKDKTSGRYNSIKKLYDKAD